VPVVFSPEARRDLIEIYDYIEAASSANKAFSFTSKIADRCQTIAILPETGTPHDDIRPGLRTISFRRRVLIAYHVGGESVVIIDRILYGGRDLAKALA